MNKSDPAHTFLGIITAILALLCFFGSNESAYHIVGIVFVLISAYCFAKGKGGDGDTGIKY